MYHYSSLAYRSDGAHLQFLDQVSGILLSRFLGIYRAHFQDRPPRWQDSPLHSAWSCLGRHSSCSLCFSTSIEVIVAYCPLSPHHWRRLIHTFLSTSDLGISDLIQQWTFAADGPVWLWVAGSLTSRWARGGRGSSRGSCRLAPDCNHICTYREAKIDYPSTIWNRLNSHRWTLALCTFCLVASCLVYLS